MNKMNRILPIFLFVALSSPCWAEPLPWFVSDRFDVYRQGTNDIPVTFQWVKDASAGQGQWQFYAPAGSFRILYDGFDYWANSSIYWDQSSNYSTEPPDTYVHGWPARYVMTGGYTVWGYPFGIYLSGPEGDDIFQLEWIEPSLQRCFDHAYAGFLLGIPADLMVLLGSFVRSLYRSFLGY